jgi:hypothetical protein
MPLRSLIALALVAVLAALIVWAIVVLVRSRRESAITRASLIASIIVLIAIVLWIVFILPAYWD